MLEGESFTVKLSLGGQTEEVGEVSWMVKSSVLIESTHPLGGAGATLLQKEAPYGHARSVL